MCRRLTANSPKFPVLSLFNREFGVETGSLETASSASYKPLFYLIYFDMSGYR
jgi:hypothetical protein